MTDDERFDRLAIAIERVADASTAGIQSLDRRYDRLEQAHLGLTAQVGLLADAILQIGNRVEQVVEQQAAMQQRQAEQDQRFDVLLGEIRHIIQRLDEGSQS